MHSIHYLDLIRQLLGDPAGVHAKSIGHPSHDVAQTRTTAILDYGTEVRCALSINHDHKFGRRHQACEFRICGTEGAAYLQLGVNLDYPRGEPDILEIFPKGGRRMGVRAAPGRMVSGRLRRTDGQPPALCGRRRQGTCKLGRRCLEYDGPGRGGLPVEFLSGNTSGKKAVTWRRRPIETTRSAPCAPHWVYDHGDGFVVHAGHTGDFFPHHMDAEFMKTTPFGQRIAHGTLVFSIGIGLTASVVNPVAFSYGYDRLRFVKPVFIGDTIRTRTTIVSKEDDPSDGCGRVFERCEVINHRDEVVLVADHIYIVERRETQPKSQSKEILWRKTSRQSRARDSGGARHWKGNIACLRSRRRDRPCNGHQSGPAIRTGKSSRHSPTQARRDKRCGGCGG